MLKQTLFFAQPCKLSLKLKQLVIERDDLLQPVTRPIEDLSVVIIENQQVITTIPLLNELANNNVAVIFCDDHFMPSAQLMPLSGNATQQESHRYQSSWIICQKMAKNLNLCMPMSNRAIVIITKALQHGCIGMNYLASAFCGIETAILLMIY